MDARSELKFLICSQGRAQDLDLRGANLAGAELSRLMGDRLNLRVADLHGAKLCAARLEGCHLGQANLSDTNWSGATLRLCVLDAAQGADACFDNARIEDCTAKGTDLSRASLRGSRLSESSFARAILRDAVLEGATGDGVDFRGADLMRATLTGARLDESDFRGADLTGANLSGGRFQAADFRGAILDETRFDGADCAGARFDDGEGPFCSSPLADARDADAKSNFFAEGALRAEWTTLQNALHGTDETTELIDRLQRAMAQLDLSANEPPSEWKRWLEPLMEITEGAPSLDALVATLQSTIEKMSLEDLQAWLNEIVPNSSDHEVTAHRQRTTDG
jgi:uncharacterized protein YjbI with pentapeptide repeats